MLKAYLGCIVSSQSYNTVLSCLSLTLPLEYLSIPKLLSPIIQKASNRKESLNILMSILTQIELNEFFDEALLYYLGKSLYDIRLTQICSKYNILIVPLLYF